MELTECGLQGPLKRVTNELSELTKQASKMRDEFHRALPPDEDLRSEEAADGAAINNNNAGAEEAFPREDTVPSMSGRPSVGVDGG